jgi:hypothetical protein
MLQRSSTALKSRRFGRRKTGMRTGNAKRTCFVEMDDVGLDAFTREELWDVLQNIWPTRRFTTILVTHDLRARESRNAAAVSASNPEGVQP